MNHDGMYTPGALPGYILLPSWSLDGYTPGATLKHAMQEGYAASAKFYRDAVYLWGRRTNVCYQHWDPHTNTHTMRYANGDVVAVDDLVMGTLPFGPQRDPPEGPPGAPPQPPPRTCRSWPGPYSDLWHGHIGRVMSIPDDEFMSLSGLHPQRHVRFHHGDCPIRVEWLYDSSSSIMVFEADLLHVPRSIFAVFGYELCKAYPRFAA